MILAPLMTKNRHAHNSDETGGYRIVAIMGASQAPETGSIPVTRSMGSKKTKRQFSSVGRAMLS